MVIVGIIASHLSVRYCCLTKKTMLFSQFADVSPPYSLLLSLSSLSIVLPLSFSLSHSRVTLSCLSISLSLSLYLSSLYRSLLSLSLALSLLLSLSFSLSLSLSLSLSSSFFLSGRVGLISEVSRERYCQTAQRLWVCQQTLAYGWIKHC